MIIAVKFVRLALREAERLGIPFTLPILCLSIDTIMPYRLRWIPTTAYFPTNSYVNRWKIHFSLPNLATSVISACTAIWAVHFFIISLIIYCLRTMHTACTLTHIKLVGEKEQKKTYYFCLRKNWMQQGQSNIGVTNYIAPFSGKCCC